MTPDDIAGKGEIDDELLPKKGEPVPQRNESGGKEAGADDVPDEGLRAARALRRRESGGDERSTRQ